MRVMVVYDGCESELVKEGGASRVGGLAFQPCWVEAIDITADEDVGEFG